MSSGSDMVLVLESGIVLRLPTNISSQSCVQQTPEHDFHQAKAALVTGFDTSRQTILVKFLKWPSTAIHLHQQCIRPDGGQKDMEQSATRGTVPWKAHLLPQRHAAPPQLAAPQARSSWHMHDDSPHLALSQPVVEHERKKGNVVASSHLGVLRLLDQQPRRHVHIQALLNRRLRSPQRQGTRLPTRPRGTYQPQRFSSERHTP